MSVIGVIPARMGSSRFPGKPLHPILGKPMLEHVYRRAEMCGVWEKLIVATPDLEIADWCHAHEIPNRVTWRTKEGRALDACAEAVEDLPDYDIIVNVQGDEPMVTPENIRAVVDRLENTWEPVVLCVPLKDGDLDDPNAVKILATDDRMERIIYTTRAPVRAAIGRIGGLLGFRNVRLQTFSRLPHNVHETAEACDINRWLTGDIDPPLVARARSAAYQSVDCLEDVAKVEKLMVDDPYWGKY